MPDENAQVTNIRKRLGLETHPAILGDTATPANIWDNSKPGNVWVRYLTGNGYSTPISVRGPAGKSVKLNAGAKVTVGYDDDMQLAVLGIDFAGAVASGINPVVSNNGAQPANNGFVGQDRFSTLVCYFSTGMVVAVRGGKPIVNYVAYDFGGADVDLTSFIPAVVGNHRVVVIFLKSDYLTIEAFGSTEKEQTIPLDFDDLNEALALHSANSTPIWAYRLYYGETSGSSSDTFMDCRQLVNFTTTSGGSISVTDGATTVNPVSSISFTSGATVTDGGSGTANVAVAGGSGITQLTGDVTAGPGSGSQAATVAQVGGASAANVAKAVAALSDKFLLQTADATNLPNAQAMGALATGLVKNTTTTGVQSIASAGTDYTSPTGTENLSNKTITASTGSFSALALTTSPVGGYVATSDASGNASWQPAPSLGALTYYFQNTASDISTYLKMLITPYTPKTTLSSAGLSSGLTTLRNFATAPNIPNLTFIPAGPFEFHIHAAKTAGVKNAVLYCEFWEVNAAGADIAKIVTTESTAILAGSETEYIIIGVTTNTYTLASSTSRIVARIIANVTGAGTAPTVALYVGDTADSHIALPSPTVDASNFALVSLSNVNTQSANTVFAGPTSGGAATPAFRAVVPADLPVMVASGASHAAGICGDPGASAGTTKFWREDASWATPSTGASPASSSIRRDNGATYSSTSSSFVDIDGTNLAITITTSGGNVLVGFTGKIVSGNNPWFDITVDGTRWGSSGNDGLAGQNAIGAAPGLVILVTGLSAGSHTFKIQWKVVGGVVLYSGNGTSGEDLIPNFWATEIL